MKLNCFSVSLAVKDLATSRAFYEKLGFETMGGDADNGWLILKQGTTKIGLFQGMFEGNLLTFNPGWADDGAHLEQYDDVRDIQATLQAAGIEPVVTTDPEGTGPANIVLVDPDGNQILIDQHVGRPG